SLGASAEQSDIIQSISACGAGAARTSPTSRAVAGPVSVNYVLSRTYAYLSGVTALLDTDSFVHATDESKIVAVAGALGYGGTGGYGIGIGVNLVGFSNNDNVPNEPGATRAYVEDSAITIAGGLFEVRVSDDNHSTDPRILAVSGAIGWGSQQASTA